MHRQIDISKRRYIGSKRYLLGFIDNIVKSEVGEFGVFCDIFSGSGVVADYFNKESNKIIANDLLYHNYVALEAFLGAKDYDVSKLDALIKKFNEALPENKQNYFSKHFSHNYFSYSNALKAGMIREQIETLFKTKQINTKEKFILMTSLNYAIDKIANTLGHYDAFINKKPTQKSFVMQMLKTDAQKNKNNEIYNEDANTLIKKIECDILYIDPPYNSRQYCDAYHLLENLSLWQKSAVFGKTKKFDRKDIQSGYSKVDAPLLLDNLIKDAKCRYILLSYNNTYKNANRRSHAKISDEQIIKTLSKRGDVKIFKQRHKAFNSPKNVKKDNFERVFFVKVK